MKRAVLVAGVLGVLGSVTWGVAALGATTAPPRAQLRSFVCQHALDPAARAVSIKAVMRPLAGTKKMQLRFQLWSSSRSRGSSTVTGGDLGTWITPADPTLGQRRGDVWILNKQVVDLAAPAKYHFRVSFKWLGPRGHVLGSTVRESRTCYQPELRPDLAVQSIAVQSVAGHPKLNRYVATIRNNGATAASMFEILFTPGGSQPVQTKDVSGLAAHSKLERAFVGPACSSSSPTTVTVDPNDQVDDYNRSNNSMTAAC
jgi:CARDB